MKTKILEDHNGDLEISLSEDERKIWSMLHDEDPEKFDTDDTMYELFERLICNSEFEWIRPEQCGALTSAPILGYTFDNETNKRRLRDNEEPGMGNVHIGGDEGGAWVVDVEKCWGWMSYAVKSLQAELLSEGVAILQRGHYDEKYDGLATQRKPEPAASSGSSPG